MTGVEKKMTKTNQPSV